ncbi:MAG: hypothetical protein M5U01_41970 [Ardenticatenaceae bacterium]|nr:hypothetical protein [Ardenticatenaceae bacterium]
MGFPHRRKGGAGPLVVWGLVLGLAVVIFLTQDEAGWASPANGAATIFSPNRVSGAAGRNDERDADVYPAAAYDPVIGRYLAVWMTPRNAQSSSDGFDVYGVFLDRTGRPVGSEFRISDSNAAARNGPPAVAAGHGEFAVAWTRRGASCQIYVQRVTDASFRTDRVLTSGSGHHHSPSLIYNPVRQRYALAYVEGDDYLPPTFVGAQTADCGNNISSTSSIQAMEFSFSRDDLVGSIPFRISDGTAGTFRPRFAYSAGLNQYLAAWEDRRNAAGQPYRFDVYAHRLHGDMTSTESDILLAAGGTYTNDDTSATWTPRPVVAGGNSSFLAAWFSRETQDSAVIWSVTGRLVPVSGSPLTPFRVAEMSFAQSHAGQSPTGFLAAASLGSAQEYLVGMTSHLESVWGYLSFALIQRVSNAGQLLKMDGSPQSQPGVGSSVDYENDEQVAISIAENPASGVGTADYLAVYSKHSRNRSETDFDIWGARVQIATPALQRVYLPLLLR